MPISINYLEYSAEKWLGSCLGTNFIDRQNWKLTQVVDNGNFINNFSTGQDNLCNEKIAAEIQNYSQLLKKLQVFRMPARSICVPNSVECAFRWMKIWSEGCQPVAPHTEARVWTVSRMQSPTWHGRHADGTGALVNSIDVKCLHLGWQRLGAEVTALRVSRIGRLVRSRRTKENSIALVQSRLFHAPHRLAGIPKNATTCVCGFVWLPRRCRYDKNRTTGPTAFPQFHSCICNACGAADGRRHRVRSVFCPRL